LEIGDIEKILEGYSELDDDETKEFCFLGANKLDTMHTLKVRMLVVISQLS
jgi:hypothetical protein